MKFLLLIEQWDAALAAAIAAGTLDKRQTLGALFLFREAVRQHCPDLAEIIALPKTEAAELQAPGKP